VYGYNRIQNDQYIVLAGIVNADIRPDGGQSKQCHPFGACLVLRKLHAYFIGVPRRKLKRTCQKQLGPKHGQRAFYNLNIEKCLRYPNRDIPKGPGKENKYIATAEPMGNAVQILGGMRVKIPYIPLIDNIK